MIKRKLRNLTVILKNLKTDAKKFKWQKKRIVISKTKQKMIKNKVKNEEKF